MAKENEELARRTRELVTGGAVLEWFRPVRATLVLASLEFGDDGLFRWCAVFPEDQHHAHATPYKRAELEADVINIYGSDGEPSAFVVPLEPLFRRFLPTWSAWRELMAAQGAEERLAQFMKNALG